jgi:hypothetical protein
VTVHGLVNAALSWTLEGFPKPEIVEAIGVLCDVKLCRDLGVHNHFFEGDSLNVVNAIKRRGSQWCRYGHVVKDIQRVLRGLRSWDIRHVKSDANLYAHDIAKMTTKDRDYWQNLDEGNPHFYFWNYNLRALDYFIIINEEMFTKKKKIWLVFEI